MKWCSALILVTALAACANNAAASNDLNSARAACAQGASHAEISLTGVVNQVLGVRRGSSGSHEGFIVNGVRVEDNVDITGYIPLRRGDRVALVGQYECSDSIIHWTHRDPRGRHIQGYVTVNGRTYR